jgi:superfamily II DNA helicase RecQ
VEYLSFDILQGAVERPTYLRVPQPYRVLLCTRCGQCYVRSSYERHIRDVHHLKGAIKRLILDWLSTEDIADTEGEVQPPLPNQPPIQGLTEYDGFACNSIGCQYLTTSRQLVRKHVSKAHSQRYSLDNGTVSTVKLQTFFAKQPQYFRVSNCNSASVPASVDTVDVSDARTDLDSRYQLSLQHTTRSGRDQETQHISEVTPWLRTTTFHIHKEVFGDVDDFRDVLRLPHRDGDLSLSLVCESVDRILRRGLDQVQDSRSGKRLHRLDAQHLNSFQAGVISQDPFQRLDRERSVQSYSKLFQQLVSYFFRVENDYFGHAIFKVTSRQRQSSTDVMDEAMKQAQAQETDHNRANHNSDGMTSGGQAVVNLHRRHCQSGLVSTLPQEGLAKSDNQRLDQLTLEFCLSLIQHQLVDSSFDNAILSFCAVLAWDSSRKAWRKDLGNYSSYLSQLIYVCQVLILLQCYRLVEDGQSRSLSAAIVAQRDEWLQNTSRGPVGDLQAWRLYARSVANTSVGIAQVRWYQDGLTLAYQDISYRVSYLHDEMVFCMHEARRIFQHDLTLNLPDVPVYPVEKLVDNWDSTMPQMSFIDDSRNTDCLGGGQDWLYNQILASPALADTVLQQEPDSRWIVNVDFAHQYETAVQHFLEFMLTILYKGSGQPARRPEMLGLRWQNTQYDQRNLFIHDGYILFILTYHKWQSQHHASRYPVRFLLPEAGELMVQFLVLIQPFRRWVAQETGVPPRVSEYLWSGPHGVWTDDRMTRLIQRNSLLSVGVSTHVQAWRQIAVGIAIKFFSGMGYQADLDREGDTDDDNGGRPLDANMGDLPEVFHRQATHAPRTGNQVYGGTVNFKDGLTDAGLQQYLQASQMWHRLCHVPPLPRAQRGYLTAFQLSEAAPLVQSAGPSLPQSPYTTPTPPKRRPTSLADNTPLPKRLAVRRTPQRHHRRWTTDDALVALRSLFGRDATYRSPAQAQMIEHIVSGRGEVVAALATSEGKSLAFMLPARLPQAGATVVILPLVVLKQEMFRRCEQLGLPFTVWDRHGDHIRYDGCPLIFVSAETAVLPPFRAFITGLDAREGLDRVVVDESHLILTASDYRPKLKLIKHLRTIRCQFVFLSATLPPLLLTSFYHRLLLFDPVVIRSHHTFRRDLQYTVAFTQSRPSTSFIQQVVQGIRSTLALPNIQDDPTARVIIYTLTRDDAREMAAALEIEAYFSDSGTVDEKAAMLTRWIEGCHRAIVATSAFGMGIDYPRVAAIFHIGAPTNAIDFAQEVGRLGRDGRGGHSTVILPPNTSSLAPSLETESLLPVTQQVMNSYTRLPRCHTAILSWFLDGSPWYCDAEDPARRCSRCRRLGLWSDQSPPEEEPAWLGKKQQRRIAINDGQSLPSDMSSTSSSGDDELPGPEVLRQHVRDEARGRERYVRQLEEFRGCCMICRLLIPAGHRSDSPWHNLVQCRSPRKQDFFTAKKAAIQVGKTRLGWLTAYCACYGCGNPQEVCQSQGAHGCEFQDIVFPTSWAFFHLQRPFGKSLEQWTGRGFISETVWMTWLGEAREVYGMRATNAVWIASQVFQVLGEQ